MVAEKIYSLIKHIRKRKLFYLSLLLLSFGMFLVPSEQAHAVTDELKTVTNIGGNIFLTWFVIPLTSVIMDVLVWVLDQLTVLNSIILQATDVSKLTFITETWKVVRDGVNIVFIAVLLVVGIFNIINYEPDTYALTEYMPFFTIAVIGVNFSKLMCIVILDFTNVLTASIFTFIGGAGDPTGSTSLGKYGENIGPVVKSIIAWDQYKTVGFFKGENLGGTTSNYLAMAIQLIIGVIIVGFLVYGFAGLVGLYLVRLLQLWVLISSSPLFFMGISSQYLRNISDGWWESFWKYASMPIKISAYMSIGLLLANKIVQGTDGFFAEPAITDLSFSSIRYLLAVISVIGTLMAAFDAGSDDGVGQKINEALRFPVGHLLLSTAKNLPILPGTGLLKVTGVHKINNFMQKSKVGGKLAKYTGIAALGNLAENGEYLLTARMYEHIGKSIYEANDADIESKVQDRGGRQAEAITGAWADLPFQKKMFGADTLHQKYHEKNIAGERQRGSEIAKGLEGYNEKQLLEYMENTKNNDQFRGALEAFKNLGTLPTHLDEIVKVLKEKGASIEDQKMENGKIVNYDKKVENSADVYSYFNQLFGESNYMQNMIRSSISQNNQNVQGYEQEVVDNFNGLGTRIQELIARKKNGGYVPQAQFEAYMKYAQEYGKEAAENLPFYMMQGLKNGLIKPGRFDNLANALVNANPLMEALRDIPTKDLDKTFEDLGKENLVWKHSDGTQHIFKSWKEIIDFSDKMDLSDANHNLIAKDFIANVYGYLEGTLQRTDHVLGREGDKFDKDYSGPNGARLTAEALREDYRRRTNNKSRITKMQRSNIVVDLLQELPTVGSANVMKDHMEKLRSLLGWELDSFEYTIKDGRLYDLKDDRVIDEVADASDGAAVLQYISKQIKKGRKSVNGYTGYDIEDLAKSTTVLGDGRYSAADFDLVAYNQWFKYQKALAEKLGTWDIESKSQQEIDNALEEIFNSQDDNIIQGIKQIMQTEGSDKKTRKWSDGVAGLSSGKENYDQAQQDMNRLLADVEKQNQ